MKNLFYLLIVLPIITLQSCVDQNTPETTFSLINNSSVDIILKPYSRNRGSNGELIGGYTNADIININNGERMSITREQRDNRTFYSIRNVDSIRVIFNNRKIAVLICDDWPDMANCNTIFRGDSNNSHIITENDYNNSEDCNDNCD
ncbi:MAG: hypothetical protein L3J08_06060 [Flavobacteriaceae bacterium]|nr:hypothetical protein [Flavobacteriaceae bacterium]